MVPRHRLSRTNLPAIWDFISFPAGTMSSRSKVLWCMFVQTDDERERKIVLLLSRLCMVLHIMGDVAHCA